MEALVQRQMPLYQCHKKVFAVKISEIIYNPNGCEDNTNYIVPAEEGYGKIEVTDQYISKHDPQVGGYYVAYPSVNGKPCYTSYSPADAFEDGYTLVE